jgi:hypothetical protein
VYIPTPGLEQALMRWWSRWVLRGRKPRPAYLIDGGLLLTYTIRYRLTAAVTLTAFTALYVFAWVDGSIFDKDTLGNRLLIAGSILIWLLFAGLFVSSQIERVVITPTQLRRRSWRGRQEIMWGEVSVVRIDYANTGVKIGVEGGVVIDVSFYLDGLTALGDALQQHQRLPRAFLATVLSDRAIPDP